MLHIAVNKGISAWRALPAQLLMRCFADPTADRPALILWSASPNRLLGYRGQNSPKPLLA